MNENGGKYAGLDRFEARKQIVADLEAQGYLVQVKKHNHAVGHCYRCNTVIEPRVSKQWFVKMKPLAEPALEAVRSGKIKIQPKRWEKVYYNWLENIRDRCISRQIWWGHRIPAWYGPDGQTFVAKNEQEAKNQSFELYQKEVELTQETDVLDTWFSSALWPFSTMGWPEKTELLQHFYPTSTLVTGADIIFFRVARMVMFGLYEMKDVPFHDVFFHGIVRDELGRKMSKSYNNYIGLLEEENSMLKKIKQIPTNAKTIEEPKNPDECNVYQLNKLFLTPEEDQELRRKYEAGGLSYKVAKDYLFEKMRETLEPIQAKFKEISEDEVSKMLHEHSEKANAIAEKKIQEVYERIGFFL